MVIEILFFGPAKDVAGAERVAVEIDEHATIAELRERLADRSEELKQLLKVARMAQNKAFVSDNSVVSEGDEIAVIPPVSGG